MKKKIIYDTIKRKMAATKRIAHKKNCRIIKKTRLGLMTTISAHKKFASNNGKARLGLMTTISAQKKICVKQWKS